ncbi:MAG: inositol monophosphatase [Salinivirgaceae bacterium]|nr:inositol monophosphatase [Salinivirgaceae bacterium]
MDYYKEITFQVMEWAKKAGSFILEQHTNFSRDLVESKGHQDFVSYVDKETEKMLVAALRELIPSSGFIVEEKSASHNNEAYIWVIDPLDGTTNFIHGVTPFAISIALLYNNEPVIGIVYELGRQEFFYSWKGAPVYCNGKEIKVSKAPDIASGLISTGFHISDVSKLNQHLKTVYQVVSNSHGLRRHGSAATDLAYVAAGRFDGFFEYGLSPWDVAAGSFLVVQAGGKVSDYLGGQNYFYGREIVAGTAGVHAALLKLLHENRNS